MKISIEKIVTIEATNQGDIGLLRVMAHLARESVKKVDSPFFETYVRDDEEPCRASVVALQELCTNIINV